MFRFNDDQQKPFECLTCGRTFKSEGGFTLHGPCGPGYRKGRGQKNNKGGEEARARAGAGCPCGGSKRLLSENNSMEARAIKGGAVSVCVKCNELF